MMKKALVLCLICCGIMSVSLSAQKDSSILKKDVYIHRTAYFGMGLKYPYTGSIYMFGFNNRNGWGINVSHLVFRKSADARPSDFDGGTGIFGDVSDRIDDKFRILSFRVKKEILLSFPFNPSVFGIELGPSIAWYQIAEKFVPVLDPCTFAPLFCSANYTYEILKSKSWGLSVRGHVGFKISRFMTLEFGANANLNSRKRNFAGELILTFSKFEK